MLWCTLVRIVQMQCRGSFQTRGMMVRRDTRSRARCCTSILARTSAINALNSDLLSSTETTTFFFPPRIFVPSNWMYHALMVQRWMCGLKTVVVYTMLLEAFTKTLFSRGKMLTKESTQRIDPSIYRIHTPRGYTPRGSTSCAYKVRHFTALRGHYICSHNDRNGRLNFNWFRSKHSF